MLPVIDTLIVSPIPSSKSFVKAYVERMHDETTPPASVTPMCRGTSHAALSFLFALIVVAMSEDLRDTTVLSKPQEANHESNPH